MTSITDIPLSDAMEFFDKNGQKIPINDDKIYSELKTIILSGKIMKYYPDSIIDWIVAHNLIISNKNINSYEESEINSLSYDELKDLAFILKLDHTQFKNREGLQKSIANILSYLGKLEKLEKNNFELTKKDEITLTGNYDIDRKLLFYLDNKSLNQLPLNNYTRKLLNDQKFWKQRLQKRLKLTSKRDDLDFKTITKFLDNGKSFQENYEEAMNKNYGEVVYILIENKVVKKFEPFDILREVLTDVPALAEIKSLSDQDFYNELINQSNEIAEDEDKISMSYFNKIVFTGDVLKIVIPNFLEDPDEDRDENDEDVFDIDIIDIKNDGMGLTNGKIIRTIANSIPTVEELKRIYIDYATKYPRKVYDQIEKERKYHKDRMEEYRKNPRLSQRVKDIKDELDKINETYPPLEMMRLLKNPKDLAIYIAEHGDVFNGYEYGSHIYFEGLSKYNGEYHLDLGS